MTSRDSILDRIRRSLTTAHLPAALPAVPPRPPIARALDSRQLADTFATEAIAVGATVHRPTGNAEAIETVIGLLRDSGGSEILAWDDTELPLAGVGNALRNAGFNSVDPTLPSELPERTTKLAALGRASAGVTGALAGLADTGTLVVLSGPGRPRLASLLPPIHIGLLPVSGLYPTMASFFDAPGALIRDHSNLVFITGPSRSADIEHTLTVGVHGPKMLHIVLLPDRSTR